jgi:exonuclease III
MPAELKVLSLNIHGLQNKLNHVVSLILKYKPHFIFLQETYITKTHQTHDITHRLGLKHSLFALGSTHTGVATLQISEDWKITQTFTDKEGRVAITQINNVKDNNTQYTLVNIYAPAQRIQQPHFYESLEETLRNNYKGQNLVLGGDFNCVLMDIDLVGGTLDTQTRKTRIRGPSQVELLQNIIDKHGLVDAYRQVNKTGKDKTHKNFGSLRKARIDRIYVVETNTITKIEHLTSTLKFTDHKAVNITLNMPQVGPNSSRTSIWKFNNTLLQDTNYITHMTKIMRDFVIDLPDDNVAEYWEILKRTVRRVSQILAKQINKQRKKVEHTLEEAIRLTKDADRHSPQIHILQEELDRYQQHRYNGAFLRTKLNTVTQEIPNKTYLGTEQNVQRSRQVRTIFDAKGILQSNTEEIMSSFHYFYQDLYTGTPTQPNIEDSYLPFVKCLTDNDKQTLDGHLTLADFNIALSTFEANKSPGPDGLTSEFFKHFFPLLGPLFVKMTNEIFIKQRLPDSLNESHITLIHKDNTDKTHVNNYRPISLLNTDYKIIAKALANKLKPHMHILIHEDQQCSVQDRNITTHTHFLRDIIDFTFRKNSQACILSLDQEKAFDRVSHSFLHKILDKSNLGSNFCTWIKILYKTPRSRVKVNHMLSEPIEILRSVRQGCPLSPSLFVLTLEPILEKIRRDTDIIGLSIPGTGEKKVLAYADDTSLLLTTFTSIQKTLDTFEHFGEASGSKVNINKSTLMGIGK